MRSIVALVFLIIALIYLYESINNKYLDAFSKGKAISAFLYSFIVGLLKLIYNENLLSRCDNNYIFFISCIIILLGLWQLYLSKLYFDKWENKLTIVKGIFLIIIGFFGIYELI